MPSTFPWFRLLLFGLVIASLSTLAAFPANILRSSLNRATTAFKRTRGLNTVTHDAYSVAKKQNLSKNAKMNRPPVYFLSHGGPNIMEETHHPAYAKLQEIGREITQKVKPKAVVVFSGHWEGLTDTIEVNTAESMGLIYDFYDFPPHYYEWKYPNIGSPELAEKILKKLQDAGIKAEGVRRGLDHGVWASFNVAFDPKENPLNVPIVQASMFGFEDPNMHYELGKAISSLRDEGIQVIVSGMAVHNLRDMWRAMGRPGALDYVKTFDEALKEAVETPPEKRQEAMAALMKRADARKAHPSWDHLLPIYIGAGAAYEEKGERLWTFPEGSMSWAQYRFGEVSA